MSYEKNVEALLGGKQGMDDILSEVMQDKMDDDGILVYVPPMSPLEMFSDDDVEYIANTDSIFMFRYVFEDLRNHVREMMEGVFEDLKNHELDSEIRVNPEFSPNFSDEDIDYVTKAILDGGFDG